MPPPTDMPNYVTREEIKTLEEKLERRFDSLDQKFEQKFAPYGSLEAFGITLIDHMERMEKRLYERLHADLARHVKAANEENRRYFQAMDEKYGSLPARVERLEATAPKRRRR